MSTGVCAVTVEVNLGAETIRRAWFSNTVATKNVESDIMSVLGLRFVTGLVSGAMKVEGESIMKYV